MDGWRVDVGYPEDRETAERRLDPEGDAGPEPGSDADTGAEAGIDTEADADAGTDGQVGSDAEADTDRPLSASVSSSDGATK
jgi:hypothetical protein